MSEKITLRFVANRTLVSLLVRLLTFSKYSHVDYIFEDGSAYSSLPYTGVDYNYDINDVNEYVEVRVNSREKVERFLLDQRHKAYDWKAIFGIPFGRKWNSKGSWFCSELISAALQNDHHLLKTKHHRITPGDLYNIIRGIE